MFPARRKKQARLVFVGRASPDKGPADAIRVARKAGLPISLLVKVNEPEERAYWDRAVAPLLGADTEVVFNADHPTKVDRLSRAQAMVFPLHWDEPFGLVMIEALACGTPVVAYARGAAPEIITDGVTGYLFDPGADLGALAEAVTRTTQLDPADCRARFEDRFSAARMVDEYERVYAIVTGTDDEMPLVGAPTGITTSIL